jgi:hypothetical protein
LTVGPASITNRQSAAASAMLMRLNHFTPRSRPSDTDSVVTAAMTAISRIWLSRVGSVPKR